jgi:hypothetical protein
VRRQALWVVVGQLIVAVNGALICYAMWGALSSRSALIGGVIGAAATLAQVLIGMRGDGTGLVRGSTAKLVVTAILLAGAGHADLAGRTGAVVSDLYGYISGVLAGAGADLETDRAG